MANVIINNIVPSDGDPEGLIEAQKGALFYKTGSLYKINYYGFFSASWQNVYFHPYNFSPVFLTSSDLDLIPAPNSGGYVYVKTLDSSSMGLKFLTYEAPYFSET